MPHVVQMTPVSSATGSFCIIRCSAPVPISFFNQMGSRFRRKAPTGVISAQERHNVAVPRRELGPLAACLAALALAACTTGYSSAAPPGPTGSIASSSQSTLPAHASYRPATAYVSGAAHVYRGTETFCLRSPLSGTAQYSVDGGKVSFTLDMRGLPPKTSVGLDWINNPVRGYLVGAFTTGASGSFDGVAQMFRVGEVRAIAIKFQRPDGAGLPGIGKPCRA